MVIPFLAINSAEVEEEDKEEEEERDDSTGCIARLAM